MSLYVIILDRPEPKVWETVKQTWPVPAHHIHDERVAFVKDDTRLTAEVKETVGITSGTAGIVIQADYYSGFTSSSLVEWLAKYA